MSGPLRYPSPNLGLPQCQPPRIPFSPIYKLKVSPRPNSQLLRCDSQNQKQVKQPESLGGRGQRGKGALGSAPPTGPAHKMKERAGPHVEGDGQREEFPREVAEDAFQVVQVAAVAVAVRIGPDEVTAVRGVEVTHTATLQEGRGGDVRGQHPKGDGTRPAEGAGLASKSPTPSRCLLYTLIFFK